MCSQVFATVSPSKKAADLQSNLIRLKIICLHSTDYSRNRTSKMQFVKSISILPPLKSYKVLYIAS